MIQRKLRIGSHNQVMISGSLEGRVLSGTTGDGEEACSFSVASGAGHRVTTIRVNAYGPIAAQCRQEGYVGVYCVIAGELMNRPGKFGKLTEVRAKKVEFVSDIDNGERTVADAEQEDQG
jgi:hypothetical protein